MNEKKFLKDINKWRKKEKGAQAMTSVSGGRVIINTVGKDMNSRSRR